MSKFEFDHVSLLTGSKELAKECERFYSETLGMKIARSSGDTPEEDFALLSDGTLGDWAGFEIIGQIFEEREQRFFDIHGPGLDHLSFETEDVDEAYDSLSAAGVQFQVAPYTFLRTRIACCKDPVGTDIKITHHASPPKAESVDSRRQNSPVRLNHVGILVEGGERARETEHFYRTHFGMREIMRGDPHQEGKDWVYLEDGSGNNPFWLEIIGDVFFKQEQEFLDLHGSGLNHLCFSVEDSSTSYNHLRENGVKIEIEPLDYGPARIFFVRDPAGLMVQLTQLME
jgi:catechol 2,3-dioxygenase-like lactoylglutathione lyase family enzyme